VLLLNCQAFAQTEEFDITKQIHLDEIVVSSTKETNELKRLPASVSFITPRMLEQQRITSIMDLSKVVPNFFIPNYGSKMSTPVYIRGIGERSTGQAIGLYVDNMPYLDKSVFNFEFLDVQQIEVLRGPQGTLYGRNAMSGIINIFTPSPLEENRTRISLTGGNYGLFRMNATVSRKIPKKIAPDAGISLSTYFDNNNGFFENQFDGKRADNMRSGGGRLRLDLKPSENFTMQWITNYDYSNQGAFPYGIYKNGEISQPNYDHSGKYNREFFSSHVNLQYQNDKIIFTSTGGLQHFNDDMDMDLDYSPLAYFTLNQKQKETNFTQELTLKSNTKNNLQWVFGTFGFNQNKKTNVVTTLGEDFIASTLQPIFDTIAAKNPRAPMMVITDNEIPIPGVFKTPVYGGAVFYESTINNLFFDGFSFTMGSRLDYEKTKLDYNTFMFMNLDVTPRHIPGLPTVQDTVILALNGSGSKTFLTYLPKFALKYEFNNQNYVYFSTARGYKAGGYNIQMFADIVQGIAMEKSRNGNPKNPIPRESQDSILPLIAYNSEYSWNYELGFKSEFVKQKLFAEIAAFYIDVTDVLITQFVQSGQGRMLKNAGRAESLGVELSLRAYLFQGLELSANYGFTHAVFKDYKPDTFDFSGNFIPFAPQHTFSVSGGYTRGLRNNKFIDRFNIHAHYNGAGKIYWTEANDVYQNFYGLLNLKIGVSKGIFNLNLWTKNTLNTKFSTFYFENSFGKFAQKGTPFQIGVDFSVKF
jgi:outer membrane receptor protein involved in Fe transport